MRTWDIYEKIEPVWGDTHDDYVGSVDARDEKSALNKARKMYKYDRNGVPARRRNADNFFAYNTLAALERKLNELK